MSCCPWLTELTKEGRLTKAVANHYLGEVYISLEDYRLNLKSRGINVQAVIDGRLVRDSIEMRNTKENSRICEINY